MYFSSTNQEQDHPNNYNIIMSPTCACSSTSILLHFFTVTLYVVLLYTADAMVKLPENETIPAIIAFGDSILDTGNNNHLLTLMKCNFPPYGKNFKGGVATGRFCDGKVPTDLIAEELGITDAVPAYLDPFVLPKDLVKGVSFASGATGYDPLTPKLMSVVSMEDQLKYFKEYIVKIKGVVGEEKTKFILEKSLFLLLSSSNDIDNTYFLFRARKNLTISTYTDLMVDWASTFIKEIHNLGARRVAVFSAPPVGCWPSTRTAAGGIHRKCSKSHNDAAKSFNTKLSLKLESLHITLRKSKLVYIDLFNPMLDIIQNPTKYGFEVSDKGCCGSGLLEVAILCNQLNPLTCSNPSNFVFWDTYHPTEATYKVLVKGIIEKYLHKFF